MIRIERDPEFWRPIMGHPEVASATLHGHPFEALLPLLAKPHLPLAGQHGGYLMRNLDGFGVVWDLHAAFTPEGWGREARDVVIGVYGAMFGLGARLLVLTEQRDLPRSRGCLSHGWRLAGDYYDTVFGEMRLWLLTEDAWLASPVCRRG